MERIKSLDEGSFKRTDRDIPLDVTTVEYSDGSIGVDVKMAGGYQGSALLHSAEVAKLIADGNDASGVAFAMAFSRAADEVGKDARDILAGLEEVDEEDDEDDEEEDDCEEDLVQHNGAGYSPDCPLCVIFGR